MHENQAPNEAAPISPEKERWLSTSSSVLTIFSASIILLLPSLINGLPFLFYDSSYYIVRGISPIPEYSILWRPLTYSLFLKVVLSVGTLLLCAFAQNCLLSFVLWGCFKNWAPGFRNRHFLLSVLALYATPLPYYSNFILPDMFSGLMLLGIAGFFSVAKWRKKITWLSLFLLSAAMHYSNLIVGSLVLLIAHFSGRSKKAIKAWLPVLFLPWPLVLALNHLLAGQSGVSKAANVYLYSQLSAIGVAIDYLDEKCPRAPTPLCSKNGFNFHVWNRGPHSLIGQAGGIEVLLPEIEKANKEILFSHLALKIIPRSLGRIFLQIASFAEPLRPTLPARIGAATENDKNFDSQFRYNLKGEQRAYDSQALNFADVDSILKWLSRLYLATTIASLGLLAFFQWRKVLHPGVRSLFFFASLGYLLNALACGLLTDPGSRYGGRIVWIFPLILLLHWAQASSKRSKPSAVP